MTQDYVIADAGLAEWAGARYRLQKMKCLGLWRFVKYNDKQPLKVPVSLAVYT